MTVANNLQGPRPRSERSEQGREYRITVPRKAHGDWTPAPDRPDPIALLQAQDEGRIESLLPIKYGRMAASPFAFLRGSAAVMAADLATPLQPAWRSSYAETLTFLTSVFSLHQNVGWSSISTTSMKHTPVPGNGT